MRKRTFLFRNLLKGLLWLFIIVVAFVIIKKNLDLHPESWINKIYEQPLLVYLTFLISEIVIGIIPPEIFMIWSLKSADVNVYIMHIVFLSTISFIAGIVGYFIGKWFHNTRFYAYIQDKFFGKYERFLRRFGGFLVLVAALTPLPFSGICMIVGSARYNFRKFLAFASLRFLRFGVYAYIIWHANLI